MTDGTDVAILSIRRRTNAALHLAVPDLVAHDRSAGAQAVRIILRIIVVAHNTYEMGRKTTTTVERRNHRLRLW